MRQNEPALRCAGIDGDDEDRENEGDFIVAAEKITPEIVNFMLKEGRGVLCAPLSEKRCDELGLNMMEENNTSLLGTPFTVTVDLLGNRRGNPLTVMGRAMDDIGDDMSKSPSNFLRDVVSTGTVVALAPLSALLLIL